MSKASVPGKPPAAPDQAEPPPPEPAGGEAEGPEGGDGAAAAPPNEPEPADPLADIRYLLGELD
jgi:hypothetical protein